MSGSGSWPARQLRLLRPGRSELARRWDRIEAVFAVLAIGLCLAAIPLGVATGSTVYDTQLASARQQAVDAHPAIAITTADAPDLPLAETTVAAAQVQVPATWSGADGLERTTPIWVDPATPAGSPQPIWLDRNDEVTVAPADRSAVLGPAVGAALFAVFCCFLGATAGLVAGRTLLDRRRAAEWTREWERFSGRPNRS